MRTLGIRLSLRSELLLVLGLLLLGSIAVLALDEYSQSRAKALQQELLDNSLGGLRRAMAVADIYGVEIVDAVWMLAHGSISWVQAEQAIESGRARVELHWNALADAPRSDEQELVFGEASRARERADALIRALHAAVLRKDRPALLHLAEDELYPAINPVTVRLRQLSDMVLIDAERSVRDESERLDRVRMQRLVLLSAVLLLAALIGREMLRNILLGVASLTRMAKGMRRGNYEIAPTYRPSGELGELTETFIEMRAGLRASEAELRGVLETTERVKRSLEVRDLFQRSLLDAAQTAILSVDADGRFTHVNPFAEGLLGYRADELIGKATPDLLHRPDQLAQAAKELGAELRAELPEDWHIFLHIADRRTGATEWTLRRKDGSEVAVLQAVSVMHDQHGGLVGLLFVAADLTDVKRLEEELRESEARAREASHAKSAFVAAMSHEIRTPMIGVTGMVEVLSHTRLDDEQRRSLNIIQHSAETLLQILGDVLDVSKIEAGRLELNPEVASLRSVVAGATYNYLGSASSKGLQLEFEIDERVAPALRFDPVRLRQILANFLSNAIKFTDQGRIDLRVDVLHDDDQHQQLRFAVRDTGIGVSEEAQKRLFRPFAQAESDTTRKYGGTGLGLMICRRLAELMGGAVRMQSTPGEGATLFLEVRLPKADPADLPAESATAASAPGRFQPRPLPSPADAERERSLILLVDDHPTNRVVIARQLALAGFACETAEDGEEGLQLWSSGRFALVLSDVHMPVLDGYGMARRIRELERETGRARTPIVALTAAAMKGEAERCLVAGMDDYLIKPVGVGVLSDRLYRWLPHLPRPETRSEDALAPVLPQAGKPKPIDARVLDEIAAGDPQARRNILLDFLQASEQDVEELNRTLASVDIKATAREAHKIKGAARLVGAVEMDEVAEQMELAAKAGDLHAVLAASPDLATALQRLRWYVEGLDGTS